MLKKVLLVAVALLSASLAWAAKESEEMPREVIVNGVEFIRIPGGWTWHSVPDIDPKTEFYRGKGSRELKIWTDSFYIGKYEARARDFARFMNAGISRFTSHYDNPELVNGGAARGCSVRKDDAGSYYLIAPDADLPATNLSWDLANEFAAWMDFRLPSEAEWVRAFRGDDRRIFPWGDEYPDDTFAGFQEGATDCNVRPVTAFPKGRSPFGVYNMAGNVFEYVADWYSPNFYNSLKDGDRNPLSAAPQVLKGEEKAYRTLRGGRWSSGPNELSIYANRFRQAHDDPFKCFGTRFALDEATVRKHLEAGTATVVK